MSKAASHEEIMAKKNATVKAALNFDYDKYESKGIGFDYDKLMADVEYKTEDILKMQVEHGVGHTPIFEMKNISALARKHAKPGYGARIFLKDEAANASGSFKARRAALSVYHAKKLGFKGVVAATSGNYGAAVASQAAKHGLKCIIIQETYDSKGVGQPEILEKARKCESFGAEVLQLSVGPELFTQTLRILEETGYFLASLYSPFGIRGVDTLGYEIAHEMKEKVGKFPDAVVVTSAGGGNISGTARGMDEAGASATRMIGASINLKGLHMASDNQFNKKSFTTGHTGFSVPFMTLPDRVDVPRNAARMLRYMDEFYTVNQGEVFYITEMLAQLEGIERGPAGNTSIAAAFSIAQTMKEDEIIVVQETEYTGAGKHPNAQLTFAKGNGIKVYSGDPKEEVAGESVVLPKDSSMITAVQVDMNRLKKSYIKNTIAKYETSDFTAEDIKFICDEIQATEDEVKALIQEVIAK